MNNGTKWEEEQCLGKSRQVQFGANYTLVGEAGDKGKRQMRFYLETIKSRHLYGALKCIRSYETAIIFTLQMKKTEVQSGKVMDPGSCSQQVLVLIHLFKRYSLAKVLWQVLKTTMNQT